MKLANITPAFTKASKDSKENYRSVSILPNISKIYERLLLRQITDYFEDLFSKYQCGFWQKLCAQYCFIVMLEKGKHFVDERKAFEALLTDLLKAFDCLPHDLIIAKLNAYRFTFPSPRLIHSYLSIKNKGLKQTQTIVPGKKFSLVSHKVLSLSRSYLTFLFVIYSQL